MIINQIIFYGRPIYVLCLLYILYKIWKELHDMNHKK